MRLLLPGHTALDELLTGPHRYTGQMKAPDLVANGSHLIDAWNDPNSQPTETNLLLQESKTLDRLRARLTQWQARACARMSQIHCACLH